MIVVTSDKKALANLQRELDNLARDLDSDDRKGLRREMRAGAKDAAEIVAFAARARAPVGSKRTVHARDGTIVKINPGRLRKSIKPRVDVGRGKVAVVAGVRERDRFKGSTATRYRKPYWAAWSEFGHDLFAGGPKGVAARRGRLFRGTPTPGRGRRVGRVEGREFMQKAMDDKAAQARRVMQRSLDDLISRYNRRIKRR